ncbi:MAG: 2-amino-4-hydroxy-6-hydroxymethyldihydropteridine diphosphokinase, partial [Achromobacter pestifer]
MARAYIGLGANLGDSAATLRTVLAELQATDGIAAVTASPFYRSAPVDATGPDFVNAVATLDTSLPPLALLDVLQALENRHGRQRPYKNAPRTLDLDLLIHGDARLDHERLILPHP